MVDIWYKISNAIRNQKYFKPIANGNVADSGIISLTDEPLPCWKLNLRKIGSLDVNRKWKNSSTAASPKI